MWRRLRYVFLVTVLCSLCCFGISNPVSAYNFGNSGKVLINNGSSLTNGSTSTDSYARIYYNPTDGYRNYFFVGGNFVTHNLVLTGNNVLSGGTVTEIHTKLNSALPASSLFHFSLRISRAGSIGTSTASFNGFYANSNWTLLDSDCQAYETTQASQSGIDSEISTGTICQFYGYSKNSISDITLAGNIFTFNAEGVVAILQGVDYVQISNDSGGSGSIDLTTLENNVSTILATLRQNNTINADIYYDVEDIKELLEGLDTSIENAVNNPEYIQQEKEDLEDAESDAESSAEDASNDAETETQSLMQAIGSIIDVFRNAEPTNCKIPFNLGRGFNGGEIDLCNAPNEVKTIIQTILAIPITLAVLHVAHSMLMLYLNTVREEQK